jgi:hypothetical protein
VLSENRTEQDEFHRKLKEEWTLLWRERFDDRARAEGVAAHDYPLVLTERGHVIFATRGAKAPSFPEIVDHWRAQGKVYSPDPSVGGWGKFARTELKNLTHKRARTSRPNEPKEKQQLKNGGRGWLHK